MDINTIEESDFKCTSALSVQEASAFHFIALLLEESQTGIRHLGVVPGAAMG